LFDTRERSGRSLRAVILMLLTTALVSLAAFSSAAFAQTERYGGNQPEEQVRFGGARRSVLNQEENEGLLPFTGLDLTLLAATGAAAIGTGIVVLRRTRPRENR
jgi:hypothetical protein